MRYIIAAAMAFAIVAGIALGFTLRGTVFEAEAARPDEVPRLIPLGENIRIPAGDSHVTPFFDVANCGGLSVFVDETNEDQLETKLLLSANVDSVQGVAHDFRRDGPDGFVSSFPGVVAPKVAVEIINRGASAKTINKLLLFCSDPWPPDLN